MLDIRPVIQIPIFPEICIFKEESGFIIQSDPKTLCVHTLISLAHPRILHLQRISLIGLQKHRLHELNILFPAFQVRVYHNLLRVSVCDPLRVEVRAIQNLDLRDDERREQRLELSETE